MKKYLVLFAVIGLLIATPIKADTTSYTDWIWLNGSWIYLGSDPYEPPPPPPVVK
ncbi:MAG: hypothetical protein KKD38_06975 [Candidatus Delongbacteria bacterium]|nr:hypothetical protein [Candidatus Delongbacteria bacterium]MCG2759690.1 hypothetical protein [Candidatus Delongbacteria bacterium]